MVSWFGFKAEEVKVGTKEAEGSQWEGTAAELSGCTWATLSTSLTALYFGPSNLR